MKGVGRQEISHFPVGKGQKNTGDETGIAREEEEGGPEERLQDCTAFILFAYILYTIESNHAFYYVSKTRHR